MHCGTGGGILHRHFVHVHMVSSGGAALPASLGIVTPLGFGLSPKQLRDLAVAADQAGLDGIAVGENAGTEVMALASAMVAGTAHIRIETSIVSTLTRSAALIAMGAATLDELSDGRFVIGIGAGSPIVAGWHGKQFYPRPRTAVLDTVREVRAALRGERIATAGGFRLIGVAPRSGVQIFLSAMNDRMMDGAARHADGVVVNLCSVERARELVPAVRAARADEGVESPCEFVANAWAYAGDDIEVGRERLRWELAPYCAVPTYRAAMVSIARAEDIDRAGAAWQTGGRAAAAPLVPDELSADHRAPRAGEHRGRADETDFAEHWVLHHGPLVAGLKPLYDEYIQNVCLAPDQPWDGIVEHWFADEATWREHDRRNLEEKPAVIASARSQSEMQQFAATPVATATIA